MEMGMERDKLMRSLTALSAQIDAIRRDAFSAGVSALPGRLSEYEIQEHPALAERDRAERKAHSERRKAFQSVLERLELVKRALEDDGALWDAERSWHDRTLEKALRVAAEIKVEVQTSLPPPVLAPIESYPDVGRADKEERMTRDTLFSLAALPLVEMRCAALSSNGSNRYADHVRHSLRTFIEVVGDKALGRYVPADIQEYANLMARVPSNLSKLSQFRGMSLREAAQANARLKVPKPCLSKKTIDKYVSEVRLIWQGATASVVDIRDIGSAPFTMPRNAAPSLDREGLPAAAITKWLADAAGCREPHFRWLPVLGLLTGMRLGEMVFLQLGDFIDFEGHQAIDLRRFQDSNRPLKSKTSLRVVPIHPMLHEVGFMSWISGQPGKWLFPVFHEAADPADAAQKRMAYWMKAIGIHARQTSTFHSLRHSAKAWLRAIAGERIADLMQGHAISTVGGRYGFRLLQLEEIEIIVAGAAPRGVDFGPYGTKDARRGHSHKSRSLSED